MGRLWKRCAAALLCAALALSGAGCRGDEQPRQIKYVIGVSQANMREPWRLVLSRELEEEAAKHPEVRLVFTDAASDSEKQRKDIERLLGYGIDLLIVSPYDVEKLTPVVSEVYQKIPVIVLDRVVEGYDYSLFIGPDNDLIGKQAGEAVLRLTGGSAAKVLELKGGPHSQASADRTGGFRSVTDLYPQIRIESVTVENESRDAAEDLVGAYGDRLREFDVIFAHNDYMALGAYKAAHRLGCDGVKIVGIDGFTGPDGGLELIRGGKLDETVTCPTGGREAVQFSLDILGEVSGVPKQVILRSDSITKENVDGYERRLDRETRPVERPIRVGYAQVGTESGWRLANNESIRQAAREFGIDLTVVDADNDQQAQLDAVREFIRQKMDVIVISPIVDSGWDGVLTEARDAGIPVLLSDRKISVGDDDLFKTFIGADFIEEGRRAMRWTAQNVPADRHPVRILEIQGTMGATPTIERKRGFEMLLAEHPDYSIVYSGCGDFTREGGRVVIADYLREHDWDIDVIYSHNDDMALGAVDALKAAGIQPGKDVRIISVDGTKEAVHALQNGEINCVVECSPLLGPQLMKAVTDLMSGKELPLRIITDERVFTQETPREELKNRKY